MQIIPVLFLRGGGVFSPVSATVNKVKGSPLDVAKGWYKAGAETIHVVDMDVPLAGPSPNNELIGRIHQELRLAVSVESHIRDAETAGGYFAAGVSRLVLGAVAYQKPQFLTELAQRFPGKLAVHLDVRNGKAVIKGWTVAPNKTAMDYVEQFRQAGVSAFYYSDSEQDGVIKEDDCIRMRDFLKRAHVKAVHTTDIASPADLEKILILESYGMSGTLVGKPLYDGRIDLEGIITFAKEQAKNHLDEPTYTETEA